jgi:D-amino peptidase
MKVLISVDMEGISGIVHSSQAAPGARDYEWARTMMAGDANAAIEGALEAGATEIVVADAHDGMRNLRLNELHPAASLVSGSGRPLSMLHGVDKSFDAVFMIGYHATCGVPEGIMNHAYISQGLQSVRLNGQVVGEIGIFAAVAGCVDVPVVLVSGDDACCREATTWLPNVTTASVKTGINRFAAQCLSQQAAHKRIREAAKKALQPDALSRVQPLRPVSPTMFTVELTGSQCADAAARVPGVQRLDERTVSVENADYLQAFAALRLVFDLAASVVDTDY